MGKVGEGLVHGPIPLDIQREHEDFAVQEWQTATDMEPKPDLLSGFTHSGKAVKATIHQGKVRVSQMQGQLCEILGKVDPFHEAVGGDAKSQGHG